MKQTKRHKLEKTKHTHTVITNNNTSTNLKRGQQFYLKKKNLNLNIAVFGTEEKTSLKINQYSNTFDFMDCLYYLLIIKKKKKNADNINDSYPHTMHKSQARLLYY